MTHREIANTLNRTVSAVQLKSNRIGIKKSKYIYNEDYFYKIDSEDKAYWLGFIFADGYVRYINYDKDVEGSAANYELGIELQRSDYKHLKKFNRCIDGNVDVKYRERKSHFENNTNIYQMCLIRFYSKRFIDPLLKYNIENGKTFTLEFPNLREDLIRHFIRGFFDGDGCVCKDNLKKKTIGLDFCSASKSFLESIREILFKNGIYSYLYQEKNYTEYDKKISHDGIHRNAYRLRVKGVSNTVNLIHYLYDDSSIYLDRKKKRSYNLINECNLEERKNNNKNKSTKLPRRPEMDDFLIAEKTN